MELVSVYHIEKLKMGVGFSSFDCAWLWSELWLDDDYKQRSSEVSNSNNPVWNETFTFNITEGSSDKKLYLKVLDKDLVGSDKIGDAKVDLKDIVFGGSEFNEW